MVQDSIFSGIKPLHVGALFGAACVTDEDFDNNFDFWAHPGPQGHPRGSFQGHPRGGSESGFVSNQTLA